MTSIVMFAKKFLLNFLLDHLLQCNYCMISVYRINTFFIAYQHSWFTKIGYGQESAINLGFQSVSLIQPLSFCPSTALKRGVLSLLIALYCAYVCSPREFVQSCPIQLSQPWTTNHALHLRLGIYGCPQLQCYKPHFYSLHQQEPDAFSRAETALPYLFYFESKFRVFFPLLHLATSAASLHPVHQTSS